MRPVYDSIAIFAKHLSIENLDWPKEIVLSQRAFDRLISEPNPHEMQRRGVDSICIEVTIALDSGPCIVRPG